MKYITFILIFCLSNLIVSNFTRIFEDNFFKLPTNIYLYFILSSFTYFIAYNLVPGSIIYLINENFGIPKLVQILCLAVSTVLIGVAIISFSGTQEMQMGKVQLIVEGRATLAYHFYNGAMVIIPYLVSIYFVSKLYPSDAGVVTDV
jgi:hypothetical protein